MNYHAREDCVRWEEMRPEERTQPGPCLLTSLTRRRCHDLQRETDHGVEYEHSHLLLYAGEQQRCQSNFFRLQAGRGQSANGLAPWLRRCLRRPWGFPRGNLLRRKSPSSSLETPTLACSRSMRLHRHSSCARFPSSSFASCFSSSPSYYFRIFIFFCALFPSPAATGARYVVLCPHGLFPRPTKATPPFSLPPVVGRGVLCAIPRPRIPRNEPFVSAIQEGPNNSSSPPWGQNIARSTVPHRPACTTCYRPPSPEIERDHVPVVAPSPSCRDQFP
jgi:hypothetical protein